MRSLAFSVALNVALLLGCAAAGYTQTGSISAVVWGDGELPLYFEANRGQLSREVRFLFQGPGYTLALTDDGAMISFPGDDGRRCVVRMKLMGTSRRMRIEGRGRLPGRSHYLVGRDRANWVVNVPHYSAVVYREIYPGIDLVFHGRGAGLEYDWRIKPGASARAIRLAFQGVDSLHLSEDGGLAVRAGVTLLRHERPISFQETAGRREPVSARYRILGKRLVTIDVAKYDPARRLIIDPVLDFRLRWVAVGFLWEGTVRGGMSMRATVWLLTALGTPTSWGALCYFG